MIHLDWKKNIWKSKRDVERGKDWRTQPYCSHQQNWLQMEWLWYVYIYFIFRDIYYIRSKRSLTVDKKYNKQNCDEKLFWGKNCSAQLTYWINNLYHFWYSDDILCWTGFSISKRILCCKNRISKYWILFQLELHHQKHCRLQTS